jgi:hypothetical protein
MNLLTNLGLKCAFNGYSYVQYSFEELGYSVSYFRIISLVFNGQPIIKLLRN